MSCLNFIGVNEYFWLPETKQLNGGALQSIMNHHYITLALYCLLC
ncbi:MAG: hypothetical protein QW827_01595 [Candidatus Bathyarchaeia archaeon]